MVCLPGFLEGPAAEREFGGAVRGQTKDSRWAARHTVEKGLINRSMVAFARAREKRLRSGAWKESEAQVRRRSAGVSLRTELID